MNYKIFIDNAYADLNCYYQDIILCIKQAERCGHPTDLCPAEYPKTNLEVWSLLKKVKNKGQILFKNLVCLWSTL